MKNTCTYNDGVGFIPIPSPDPVSTAINVGQLVVEAGIALAPLLITWASGIFQHPAADARGVIAAVKPTIATTDARTRLARVLAATNTISPKAKDVEAAELLLWYRQNFKDDYKSLTYDDMIYFNNYLVSVLNKYKDGNNLYANINNSFFTAPELESAPVTASSIVSQITSSTGISPVVLFGGIGLIVVYLISKK